MKLQNKIAILLSAVALALVVAWPQFEAVAQNTACYFEQGGAKFVASSGCEIEVQSGGTLDMQSGASVAVQTLTVTGTVDVAGGDITLENDETIGNGTDGFIVFGGGQLWNTTTITASDGQTITPTVYTVYNLDTAGAVTITLAACTEGGPIVLAGDDANTITIADSNIRTDDGNAAAIGQYDLFVGMCIDSEWLEIANPTNS